MAALLVSVEEAEGAVAEERVDAETLRRRTGWDTSLETADDNKYGIVGVALLLAV